MARKSRYNQSFLFKEYLKLGLTHRNVLLSLIKQQITKETINIVYPMHKLKGHGTSIRQISIRLTDACNLRCHPYGQWGDNGYLCNKDISGIRKSEISIERYKEFIDETIKFGHSPIWYLWGGEPMLYPKIIELLKYFRERKQTVAIVTNGTNVVKNIDEIMSCVHFILVSVETAEIHNSQRPGATSSINNFKDVSAAIKTIHNEKLKRKVLLPYVLPATCITKHNLEHIDSIYQFVKPYANMHFISLGWWIDKLSADQHTSDFNSRFGFFPKRHYGWIGDWQEIDTLKVYNKLEMIKDDFSNDKKCFPQIIPDLKKTT